MFENLFGRTTKYTVRITLNGGDDEGTLLRGPLGCNVAIVAYLRSIDAMSEENYTDFVAEKPVDVGLARGESEKILRVIMRLDTGECKPVDKLTDSLIRDKNNLFSVGYIDRKDAIHDFVYNSDLDLQLSVHKSLLKLWEEAYSIKKDDPDFLKKLLELHWQHNPDEKPKPEEPAQQSQQEAQTQSQSATPASATVQTDANGVVTIGKFYRFSPVDCNTQLRKSKTDNGTNDQIESVIGTMAKCFSQAIGISLGASRGKDATDEERKIEAAKLLGIKMAGKDNGAAAGTGNQNGSNEDSHAAKEDDALTKTEEFDYDFGFTDDPDLTTGVEKDQKVKLSQVQFAIEAIKVSILRPDNGRDRMYLLAQAWAVLDDIIKEATARGLNELGWDGVHFRLGKAGVYRLLIWDEKRKRYTKLWFGPKKE